MKSSLLRVLMTLVTLAVARCQLTRKPASASLAFMNITTDSSETGFYQIYCVSNSQALIKLETSSTGVSGTGDLNSFHQVSSSQAFFNGTYDFMTLQLVEKIDPKRSTYFSDNGILVDSSAVDVDCYGVKSDKGTTDGFYAMPVTTDSTEFFIASWPCVSQYPTFFSGFQITSIFEDTCVSVYVITDGVYKQSTTQYFPAVNQVYLYTAACNEEVGDGDVTGLYVNSSRPISVIAGQSCAFIPDNTTYFCDYIAEQIPPVSELGTDHVVPPIIGRSAGVGYVVRVVATANLTVTWSSPDGTTSVGSRTLLVGKYQQIDTSVTNVPLRIQCTAKCLVMQYNKGNKASSLPDTPTDPMMMHVAAVDHFSSSGCFATANFNVAAGNIANFTNFVSIITSTGGTSSILFDGLAVSASWTSTPWGYSYTAFSVSHGAHCITVKPLSNVVFGAYSYGHSLIDWSSSAYGYTVGYNVLGTLVQDHWKETQSLFNQQNIQVLNATCAQEKVYSGSAVSTYPAPDNVQTMVYPFALQATVSSPPMTTACLNSYRQALISNFNDVSRLINFLICNHTMCPPLTGSPGTGVPLNESQTLFNHKLYAAINTAALDTRVQIDVSSTGSITEIHVTVPFTGILDTTSDSFTACRAEIRKFLIPFANWPLGNSLLPAIAGCPSVTTLSPFKFVLSNGGICP